MKHFVFTLLIALSITANSQNIKTIDKLPSMTGVPPAGAVMPINYEGYTQKVTMDQLFSFDSSHYDPTTQTITFGHPATFDSGIVVLQHVPLSAGDSLYSLVGVSAHGVIGSVAAPTNANIDSFISSVSWGLTGNPNTTNSQFIGSTDGHAVVVQDKLDSLSLTLIKSGANRIIGSQADLFTVKNRYGFNPFVVNMNDSVISVQHGYLQVLPPSGSTVAGQVLTSTNTSGVAGWAPAGWGTSGSAGTNSGANFIGTKDNASLVFKTSNNKWLTLDSMGGLFYNHYNRNIIAAGNFSGSGFDSLTVLAGKPSGTYIATMQTVRPGVNNIQLLSNSLLSIQADSTVTVQSAGGHVSIQAQTIYMDQGDFVHIGSGTNNVALSIQDGTQGANKVFASDANGSGSWATLSSLFTAIYSSLNQFASDAAAGSGGLTTGNPYINSTTHSLTFKQ